MFTVVINKANKPNRWENTTLQTIYQNFLSIKKLAHNQQAFLENHLKKRRVGYPSVMSFDRQSASESQAICDFLRNLSSARMRMTHVFHWVSGRILWMTECLLVRFSLLFWRCRMRCWSFYSVKVRVLMVFHRWFWRIVLPHLLFCMFFNRSLATCIFLYRWKHSFVTLILKSGTQ
jgi:hypothetical protein